LSEATQREPFLLSVVRWFDSWQGIHHESARNQPMKIDWMRVTPFLGLHAACLLVFVVGWSPIAVGMAAFFFFARMFAVTGFYHRYFSHRSFKTSRFMQFMFGVWGNTCVQRGPIWWASHHRYHHQVSDTDEDPHSPVRFGLMWSHMGWFMSRAHFAPRLELVKDLVRFPELRFLDRFDTLIPVLAGAVMWAFGSVLHHFAPGLGTSGPQMFVWSLVSTVVLLHSAVCINSIAHYFGRRRYPTTDNSRNSMLLSLLTFGEGWHNNHHFYQASVRQGHHWWQIDITWYILVVMSWMGLVWDLKPVPAHVLATPRPQRQRPGSQQAA
jgi:stearoyl-CoA desaturase (delta-9 desaturase)